MKESAITTAAIHKRGASTDLIVLFHAFNRTAEAMRYVRQVVEDQFPNADILAPDLPFGPTSMVYPAQVVADLLFRIDRAFEDSRQDGAPGYRKILFIGHSIGAVYARKVYICACGEHEKAPFGKRLRELLQPDASRHLVGARPWAEQVDRIILLAALNRGWSISHHQSISRVLLGRGIVLAGYLWNLFYGRLPIGFSVRKGAPFLTQLRLQWLFMLRRAFIEGTHCGRALTIQLLGSVDDLVSPNDNIDLVAGRDFVYLDVPYSSHSDVVVMDDSCAGQERRRIFEEALQKPAEYFQANPLLPEDVWAEQKEVTDVVFVIHGIRDEGFWTQKIARKVMEQGQKADELGTKRKFASETSTYGYFPMLSFLSPIKRREKVEWLMDQYAEACARYPNAERYYFVGHSNGTYLLARALEEYRACRFDRVVFAGSVVRHHYNWQKFIARGQVKAILNIMASQDWVVAYFPKGIQTLRLEDLGSAGVDGFREAGQPPIYQPQEYVQGGHGAAVKESMWKMIADFLVGKPDQVPVLPPGTYVPKKAWFIRYPLWPAIWCLILTGLGIVGWGIWCWAPVGWASGLLVVYALGIWHVVTRV